ncbi:bcl-2-binding component 3 [Suricata suricatta]|uniref:bcl-2-binding component 3 n=1 Tax=Suricata suricatta TaxID=37032 RepID=UPI001155C209|nr:bcl-2-binding component 3 [Suricata suricatta]
MRQPLLPGTRSPSCSPRPFPGLGQQLFPSTHTPTPAPPVWVSRRTAVGESVGKARGLSLQDLGEGPQPSLSPAEPHLESPVPSAPGALAGGPTQAAPGIRGEEEQWAREIGAQLRRMADDLNALYERRRQEEQQRHRPSPWRVLYNLIMGLLPLPRARGAPEMEPN